MLIRRILIAGFVLAAVGLTIVVTRGVIGQQPGTTEENNGADKKNSANGPAGALGGAGGAVAPASGDSFQNTEGAAAGNPNAHEGAADAAPPAGLGAAPGTTLGPKGRGNSAGRAGMKAPTMGNMPGMPGGMGIPGMGAMGGAGTMSGSVAEDEHLETWVSQALAVYAKTDDQDARKEQREEIAKALDRIFDVRHDRRMQELETLELRVQKLRATLETREKLKSDILKDRMEYLSREADGLGWGDGIPAPGRSAPTGFGGAGSSSSSSIRARRPRDTSVGGTADNPRNGSRP